MKSLKFWMVAATLVAAAPLTAHAASDECRDDDNVVHKGYDFQDNHGKIAETESNGYVKEITFSQSNVATPCPGQALPSTQTRDAQVDPTLDCSGSVNIEQTRTAEDFSQVPEFKEVESSGDVWAQYKFLREQSKAKWSFHLPYRTTVKWRWRKVQHGKNGENCGYTYNEKTCSERHHYTKECRDKHWVDDPDPPSSYDSGGSSWDSGGSGGSGSGSGGYESSGNPFGTKDTPASINKNFSILADNTAHRITQKALDFIVTPAQASGHYEWDSWEEEENRYYEEAFTCYDRFVKTCTWDEWIPETFLCTSEVMPIEVEFVKREEETWNPNEAQYNPLLANGYELMPGEQERASMNVSVRGHSVYFSDGQISSGSQYQNPGYYDYSQSTETNDGQGFRCEAATQNKSKWNIASGDRKVSQTPNTLRLPGIELRFSNGEEVPDQKLTDGSDKQKYGLYNFQGEQLLGETAYENDQVFYVINSQPTEVRMKDLAAWKLALLSRVYRNKDRQNEDATKSVSGQTVAVGASAGQKETFWKDTYYYLRLSEVFPGTDKKSFNVTLATIPSDAFVDRINTYIDLPLMGTNSSIEAMYDLSASGKVLPKDFFRIMGGDYQMIPGQHYELRLSILQRGVPFYNSGCSTQTANCPREKVNEDAFSEEIVIPIKYTGADDRGRLRKWYDWVRRKSR